MFSPIDPSLVIQEMSVIECDGMETHVGDAAPSIQRAMPTDVVQSGNCFSEPLVPYASGSREVIHATVESLWSLNAYTEFLPL